MLNNDDIFLKDWELLWLRWYQSKVFWHLIYLDWTIRLYDVCKPSDYPLFVDINTVN